jgi:hypothetical protein
MVRYLDVVAPTGQPSGQPSAQPSSSPTMEPSSQPTGQPSIMPTSCPSSQPSGQPTSDPTGDPTSQPSSQPSGQPTSSPSGQPSRQPSSHPTGQPTSQPSSAPTSHPTYRMETFASDVGEFMKRARARGMCEKSCSGHGFCVANINCDCYKGLSGEPLYTGPDCSLYRCPMDTAWVGAVVNANDMSPVTECSSRGLCDRSTGTCTCFPGYSGIACQRNECPLQCNGRGICLPERILASRVGRVYTEPWDSAKSAGCFCDPGYRGPACELVECPTGPDVLSGYGNEAGRDCSGRGLCDYTDGICSCFSGFGGTRCEKLLTVFK